MGQVTYEVHMPDHRKKHEVFHVNMLKSWSDRPEPEPPLLPEVSVMLIRAVEEEEEYIEQYFPGRGGDSQLDLSHLPENR